MPDTISNAFDRPKYIAKSLQTAVVRSSLHDKSTSKNVTENLLKVSVLFYTVGFPNVAVPTHRQTGCSTRGGSASITKGTTALCETFYCEYPNISHSLIADVNFDGLSIRNLARQQGWRFYCVERLPRVQALIQYLTDSMLDLGSPGAYLLLSCSKRLRTSALINCVSEFRWSATSSYTFDCHSTSKF